MLFVSLILYCVVFEENSTDIALTRIVGEGNRAEPGENPRLSAGCLQTLPRTRSKVGHELYVGKG